MTAQAMTAVPFPAGLLDRVDALDDRRTPIADFRGVVDAFEQAAAAVVDDTAGP